MAVLLIFFIDSRLTEWYTDEVFKSFPWSCHELEKTCLLLRCEENEDIDAYSDFYRLRLFVPLADVFAFKISHSVRDFMPNSTVDYSPFAVRVRPGKRQEESSSTSKKSKAVSFKNPSIMGLTSSMSSTTSSTRFV